MNNIKGELINILKDTRKEPVFSIVEIAKTIVTEFEEEEVDSLIQELETFNEIYNNDIWKDEKDEREKKLKGTIQELEKSIQELKDALRTKK
jgi:hypothetical protein